MSNLVPEEKRELQVFNDEQVALIKRTICNGATDDELKLFINQCQRTGLDPFTRQIYFSKGKDGKVQIQATIDGLRLTATRNPDYAGQVGPFWCGKDGVWKDVWLADEAPAAAKVGVAKRDWKEPLYAIALWKEYAPYFNDKLAYQWQLRPALMLAKCAEALAIRKACPNEVSGIYTAEEMKEPELKAQIVDVETGEVTEEPPKLSAGSVEHTIEQSPATHTLKSQSGDSGTTDKQISKEEFEQLKLAGKGK